MDRGKSAFLGAVAYVTFLLPNVLPYIQPGAPLQAQLAGILGAPQSAHLLSQFGAILSAVAAYLGARWE